MASLLVIIRHPPYGSSLARAAVDTALAAGAFEQTVTVLFTGAGVLNLIPEQDGRAVGAKNLGRLVSSLPLYDIETLYVDALAIANHGIDAHVLPAQAKLLDTPDIRELLRSSDHLLGF